VRDRVGSAVNLAFKALELDARSLAARKRTLRSILRKLVEEEAVAGILWGGSHWRTGADALSDCDVFCHMRPYSQRIRSQILKRLAECEETTLMIDQGNLPWFGDLVTLILQRHESFSIDIGFVGNRLAYKFFWEPTGFVIKDVSGTIRRSISANLRKGNTNQFGLRDPFKNLLLLILKIKKNLLRGHLWNAYEYVNQARRYLMFMLRHVYVHDDDYLGRPDRDVDRVLPAAVMERLLATSAEVSQASIRRSITRILDWSKELTGAESFDLDDLLAAEIERGGDWFRVRVER
jgi:hypothetical protein